ncbi:MAG: MaoC family dehydratase [Actinomycetota bacterium]|nr:MaoC family dehydratase [Actinomycetota bacterium]
MSEATASGTAQRVVRLADLPALAGQHLGTSRPLQVTQADVDAFAEVTRDRQWLHVDPQRAASGPFGTTIAHGYLTLSLATALLWDVLEVPDARQIVNIGLDRVRFTAPVPTGSHLRADVALNTVREVRGGLQVTCGLTYHVAGGERPVCTADVVLRYYA